MLEAIDDISRTELASRETQRHHGETALESIDESRHRRGRRRCKRRLLRAHPRRTASGRWMSSTIRSPTQPPGGSSSNAGRPEAPAAKLRSHVLSSAERHRASRSHGTRASVTHSSTTSFSRSRRPTTSRRPWRRGRSGFAATPAPRGSSGGPTDEDGALELVAAIGIAGGRRTDLPLGPAGVARSARRPTRPGSSSRR